MLNGIFNTASAMNANMELHQRVADNLSHINVPGFRRQLAVFEHIHGEDDAGAGRGARSLNGIQLGETQTDFSEGPIKSTGRPLDVAINGKGFFQVAGPQGPLYTRNGTFYRSEAGELVNASGFRIQGSGGAIAIPASIADNDLQIGQDGTVSAKGQTLGKLNIVTFADESLLTRAGTTLFANENGAVEVPGNAVLRQGQLESANTSAVHELIQMMVGSRHLEAAQKALQAVSEAIQQHTNMT
jgi:flagellar basal body rod protein FlgG